MKLTSKIDAVTLFSKGAEVTRLAQIELEEGEHRLVLRDLPPGLMADSLRVEGEVDGKLTIAAVDSRIVHISSAEKKLDESERRLLEKRIEKLEDQMQELEGRLQTAATQKNLMDALAAMPGSPRSPKTDWGKIFDLIGERLPGVYETINALTIAQRHLGETIEDLRGQLDDQPRDKIMRTEVEISATAGSALKGELKIRYQMPDAGWQPVYDARLDTGSADGQTLIDLVRRARIFQNSGEAWQDVELSLSTTRPSGRTGAPDLAPVILDILPEAPGIPRGALRQHSPVPQQQPEAVMCAAMPDESAGAVPGDVMQKVIEQETKVEQGGFHIRFEVPGRVTLSGRGEQKKVRIGGQKLKPALEVRATPLLDPTAFLYAVFRLDGELPLLPGEVALYRDNVYVGNGHLPLVNVGERHELGFGADDQVSVKRVEKHREKGRQGLIRSENSDEYEFEISIDNHHPRAMPVRILDRVPVSRHEKLKVERLRDMTRPDEENVDDKRGVLAWEFDLGAGQQHKINLHYRITWPKGEQVG